MTGASPDHVFSDRLFGSSAPFSHARRAGGLWFISGLIGQDPQTGRVVSDNPELQLDRLFGNLDILLEDIGVRTAALVRVTLYLTDYADFDVLNRVYAAALPAPYPARVTVQVGALPLGARFQLDAIAEGDGAAAV